MSEPHVEQSSVDNQTPVRPFEVPETIDETTLLELQGQAPQSSPNSVGEDATVQPEDNLETEEPVANQQQNQWMPNPQQLMGLVNQMVDAKLGGQTDEAAVDVDIVDEITSQGVDADGAKFMVDNVRKILSNEMGGRLESVEKKLEDLGRYAAQNQQSQTISAYESHVDSLLDNAQVSDPVEREMYKETVTARGMKKYGRDFNNNHASQEFRRLRNEHVRRNHEAGQAQVEAAQTAEAQAPPVLNATSSGSVAPSTAQELQQRLKDPNDRSMNFRGGDFQKLVGAFARGLMGSGPK